MHVPPRPAPLARVVSLSWLMARAFTKHRFGATLALPLCLLTLVTYVPRRQVFESPDRNGMVIFWPFKLWVEILCAALIFGGGMTLLVSLIPVVGPLPVAVGAFAFSVLIAVGATQMGSGAMTLSPVGPETPKGQRWQVAALAQRPGTSMPALLLARELISTLPTGTVAVAAAADDKLLTAYERFGFNAGKSRRVYRLVPQRP